jgi:hypothetical protein
VTYWSDELGTFIHCEVFNVTGPLATHTLTPGEGWVQKRHPMEAFRQKGHDGSNPSLVKARHSGPRKDRALIPDRRLCPCGNLSSYGHMTCGNCRRHKCACGRVRKARETRCGVCIEADIRIWRRRSA